jgi:hypothetical protein
MTATVLQLPEPAPKQLLITDRPQTFLGQQPQEPQWFRLTPIARGIELFMNSLGQPMRCLELTTRLQIAQLGPFGKIDG